MRIYDGGGDIQYLLENAPSHVVETLEAYFGTIANHKIDVPENAPRPALMMWATFPSWRSGDDRLSDVVPLKELPVAKMYDADELGLPALGNGSRDHIYSREGMGRKIIVLDDGTFIVPDLPHHPSDSRNHAWLEAIANIILTDFMDGDFEAYSEAKKALSAANMKRVKVVVEEPPEPERLKAAVDAVAAKYRRTVGLLRSQLSAANAEKEKAAKAAAEQAFKLAARYMKYYKMKREGDLFIIELLEPVRPKRIVRVSSGEERTISEKKVREAGVAYYNALREDGYSFPEDVEPEKMFFIRKLAFDESGAWYLPDTGHQAHPHAYIGGSYGTFCMGDLASTLDLDEFISVIIERVNMDSLFNSYAGGALWKFSRKSSKKTVFVAE